MKKRTKILVSAIFIVVLIISIVLNVILGIKSGLIKQTSSLSGSTNETWRKNDASIPIMIVDSGKYYSWEGDDCIYNVYLGVEEDHHYYIAYDTDFNVFDDMEVYFVLSNSNGQTYTTYVEKSYSPVGGDSISFTLDANYFNNFNVRIAEVWVRTID